MTKNSVKLSPIGKTTVNNAIMNVMMREPQNLDNLTDSAGMPEGIDMSKKIKKRATIGKETKWICGDTDQEIFDAYLKMAVDAGAVNVSVPLSDPHREEDRSLVPFFEDIALEWFEVFGKKKLRPRTERVYRGDLMNHPIPYFKGKRIDEIKTVDIQGFYDYKAQVEGKARSTIEHYKVLLDGIFDYAIDEGFINRSPSKSSLLSITKKKTERLPLTKDEAADIAEHLDRLSPKDMLFIALLLFTGLRRGEALALRWENIDYERNLIHVQHSVYFDEKNGNQPHLGPTKNGKDRYVPLLPQLKPILLKNRQLNGFLFGHCKPLSERSFRRTWERIEKNINLHGATAHVLRHTFATMAAQRLDPKTLQTIMGHSDISTTMNIYVHARQDNVIAAGLTLNQMYSSANCDKVCDA
ncbi:MAG: site-specific integrase [Bacteroidales bacterium]|nr:site-specific integrase [Bacteroidales bacterium]